MNCSKPKHSLKLMLMAMAVAILALPMLAVAATPPAILNDMPTDAMAYISIRSIDSLNTKVDKLIHDLGIMPPDQKFDMMSQMVGDEAIRNQINTKEAIGFCVLNLMAADKTVIGFIPVNDTAAVKAGLQATPDSNFPDIFMTNFGAYYRESGKYIVISSNAQILAQQKSMNKGIKLSAADNVIFSNSDVAAKVNLSSVMPMLKGFGSMALMSNPEIQGYTSITQIATKAIDRVSEINNIVMGISLSDAGLGIKTNIQATQGSELANYLSDQPKTSPKIMDNLPNSEIVMAFAQSFSPEFQTAPIFAILDAVAGDVALSDKVNKDDVTELKKIMKEMAAKSTQSGAAVYSAPSEDAAPGMPKQITIAYTKNAKELLKYNKNICDLITRVSTTAGFPVKMSMQSNAGKANGASYDEMSIDLSGLPIPPMIMQGMVQGLGGSPVIKQQVASISDNTTVTTMGDNAIQQAMDIVKSSSKGLKGQPGVSDAASQLPSEANMYAFVDMGKYLKMAFENQPPQNIPPMVKMMFEGVKGTVGLSYTFEDGTIKNDVYIPMELIKTGASAGMMIATMAQQGNQGQSF